jgi:hypothetical protein
MCKIAILRSNALPEKNVDFIKKEAVLGAKSSELQTFLIDFFHNRIK